MLGLSRPVVRSSELASTRSCMARRGSSRSRARWVPAVRQFARRPRTVRCGGVRGTGHFAAISRAVRRPDRQHLDAAAGRTRRGGRGDDPARDHPLSLTELSMMNARQPTSLFAPESAPADSPSATAAQYRRQDTISRARSCRAPSSTAYSPTCTGCGSTAGAAGPPCVQGETAEAVHGDLRQLFARDLPAYLATLTLCAKLVSLYELYLHPNIRAFAESSASASRFSKPRPSCT